MRKRWWLRLIGLAILALTVAVHPARAESEPPLSAKLAANPGAPTYTEFLAAVRQDQVAAVTLTGRSIQGQYTDSSEFLLLGPENDPTLPALLDQHGVQTSYSVAKASLFLTLFPTALILLMVVGILIGRRKQATGPAAPGAARTGTNPGGAGARVLKPGDIKVSFANVAGQDEVKADLEELVDFMKNPDKYTAMGARIPKGVLLYGPPGTGKTLLARAVAGEAGSSFIHFSASQFVEMFVGVGASRVRDLFATARKSAPCIIFVDELDAVGRHRSSSVGGNDEREQTLNQLLVEMDGFENADGIVVMAATNRVDILDKALLRPGRFDRQIPVDVPDLTGRREILKVHAKGKLIAQGVSLEGVARRTPGLTGADLANVLNEAALLAVRTRQDSITMNEINEAIDRVVAGGPAKQGRLITPGEKRRIAVHEAGHALAARLQPNPDPVHRVTIIPRGRAGGYTMTTPEHEQMLYTPSDLMNRLVMLLAGRAAETLMMGEASTGAQNDLERAYAMAREMVARFGMSRAIGPVGLPSESHGLDKGYSEELAAMVDREVRSILTDAARRAQDLLETHRDQLQRVSDALVEQETLDATGLDRLLGLEAEAV